MNIKKTNKHQHHHHLQKKKDLHSIRVICYNKIVITEFRFNNFNLE